MRDSGSWGAVTGSWNTGEAAWSGAEAPRFTLSWVSPGSRSEANRTPAQEDTTGSGVIREPLNVTAWNAAT